MLYKMHLPTGSIGPPRPVWILAFKVKLSAPTIVLWVGRHCLAIQADTWGFPHAHLNPPIRRDENSRLGRWVIPIRLRAGYEVQGWHESPPPHMIGGGARPLPPLLLS